LVVLVPTNLIDVTSFNLPKLTDNGVTIPTANISVVSRTTLFGKSNGASLSDYIGTTLLPAPFGAYSPTDNWTNASAGEAQWNPGFGGNNGTFLAFVINVGNLTLNAQGSDAVGNDFSFGDNLPIGTVITAFQQSTTTLNDIGTAASEDLVVTANSFAAPGPEVASGLPGIFASAFGGFLWWQKRRNNLSITLMP
jgi:hypothetical protein